MAKEQVTGLILGPDVLEWTTLSPLKGKMDVTGSGRVSFDEDTAYDQGETGESLGAGRAETIKAECKRLAGPVSVAVGSADMLLRVVSLPPADEEELAGMVELQADKVSPFPIESMVVSHEVLNKQQDHYLVLISGVKKDVLDVLGKTLAEANVAPERVDACVLAMLRLVKQEGHIDEKGRQVIVFLNDRDPEIVVLQDGVPIAFHSLGGVGDSAGHDFAGDLANEIGYTLMSLELEHAASPLSSVSVWCPQERLQAVSRPLRSVNASVALQPGQTGGAPGGSASGDTFQTVLSEALEAQCACPITMHAQETLPPLSQGVALRMAEQAEGGLDLTPANWRASAEAEAFKKNIFTVFGVLFGLWVVGAGAFTGGLYYHRWRLQTLEAKRREWRRPAMEVNDLRRRVSLIKRYMDRTQSSLECLRAVCLVQPQGVDLTSFSYRKGELVRIAGQATTAPLVYDFKNQLDGTKLFLEVKLQGPTYDRHRRVQNFDMSLKLPRDTL